MSVCEPIHIDVLEDVGLLIEPTWAAEDLGQAGVYKVVGPQKVFDTFEGQVLTGTLSPLHFITISEEDRKAVGIPKKAHIYAFIYPTSVLSDLLHDVENRIKILNPVRHPWLFVLVLGGFAYFDAEENLLSVSALSATKSLRHEFVLQGPFSPSAEALDAMQKQRRMDACMLSGLLDHGFKTIGWVHPSEAWDGAQLCPDHQCPHGALMFTVQPPGSSEDLPVIYTLHPPESGDHTEDDLAKGVPPCLLADALASMTEWSTRAQKARHAAGVMSLPKKLKNSKMTSVLMHYVIGVVVFVVYVLCGTIFYKFSEDWAWDSAVYYSIVSMSTVGYGDIVADGPGARVFTSIYILLGIALVFGLTGEWFDQFMTATQTAIQRFICCCLVKQTEHSEDGYEVVPPAWLYYLRHLAFYLLFGIFITHVLSAYIFMWLEPKLEFGTAVWHCWVTATTVGYGDVPLAMASRWFCALHILISVNWLAGFIKTVMDAKAHRGLQLKRERVVCAQLCPGLITKLDKDGCGVDQTEFVIGMLIGFGVELCGEHLDYDVDVAPLIQRFKAMDVSGDGILNREDLAFMVEQMRQQHVKQGQAAEREGKEKSFGGVSNKVAEAVSPRVKGLKKSQIAPKFNDIEARPGDPKYTTSEPTTDTRL